MSEEDKQLFNKMIYCSLIDGERALKFKRKYEDLQQKVEQQEKENKELKEENKRIFQNVNDDELLISNAMNYAELKKTEKKVEQLENIRKEAIKYIEKEIKDMPLNGCKQRLTNLLNILNKGSEE